MFRKSENTLTNYQATEAGLKKKREIPDILRGLSGRDIKRNGSHEKQRTNHLVSPRLDVDQRRESVRSKVEGENDIKSEYWEGDIGGRGQKQLQ